MDRYLCVFNRDPYWLQFTDRPGLIDLAEAALGADCHLIGMTAWRSHPGYRAEELHVDYLPFSNGDSALRASWRIPIFILTVHFYLNDVAADLAPTRIVPGSHRAARAPRDGDSAWQGHEPEIILARAGDALVFRSDVWHAGSDNRSQHDTRYLLQIHYGRREIAQHFSPFTQWRFNPAVLAAASKRQRRLLGDHEPGAYD
jgi:ectoine hydroxylase-related dioxygenase (phytanoyl-CoA dioxygenase family)